MKLKITGKLWVFGMTVACLATTTSALTLGKVRGAVLLGQPLGLTVAIQSTADEASSDLCFDADVYYGDIRQESSRVNINPLRSESGAPTEVRITTTTPVDEPIVTVYLRSGCVTKTSRKYVLLSDLVTDLAVVTATETPARTAQPAVLGSVEANARTSPKSVSVSSAVQLRQSSTLNAARRGVPGAKAPSALDVSIDKTSPKQKSRLKLSILDLVDVKDPDLRISNELSTLPSADPGRREAAGVLWRSLSKTEEDIIRDEAQQKRLAEDIKGLREISGKNQRDLQEIGQRLQNAESQRYANPVIYLLVCLLALTAVALIYVVNKMLGRRSDLPWWRSSVVPNGFQTDSAGHLDLDPTPLSPVHSLAAGDTVAPIPEPATAMCSQPPIFNITSGLDIDLDLEGPVIVPPAVSPFLEHKKSALDVKTRAPVGIHRDLPHSLHASLHAINTQEILDVRQQADFFMTLGQHEEAICLLEGSIGENASSNPLVYLDLLKVLHTLSRKPLFDYYRAEFNDIFTGRVEAYAVFGQPGNSLDAYAQICTEISEFWGTDAAVNFLEECMVRRPEDAADMYFDLDAFRDLVTLHAVACRLSLDSSSDSSLMPFSAIKPPPLSDLQTPKTDATSLGRSAFISPMSSEEQAVSSNFGDLNVDTGNSNTNLIDFSDSGLGVKRTPSKSK